MVFFITWKRSWPWARSVTGRRVERLWGFHRPSGTYLKMEKKIIINLNQFLWCDFSRISNHCVLDTHESYYPFINCLRVLPAASLMKWLSLLLRRQPRPQIPRRKGNFIQFWEMQKRRERAKKSGRKTIKTTIRKITHSPSSIRKQEPSRRRSIGYTIAISRLL